MPKSAAPIQKPIVKSSAQTWNEEKRKLIDKIARLQSENQRITLQLKAKEKEWTAQLSEKEKMRQTFSSQTSSLSNENNTLRSELLSTKSELIGNKKTISNLKLENQKMNAVIKQLKTGSTQSNANHNSTNDDNIYEVEKLLKHKYVKDVYYLVRWKNYSADDDTWQKESDLQCPHILNEYKRKMKLNRK